MKISLERNDLLKVVSQAQSVAERRNTIPILANVLIDASDAQVSFRATDLDIEILDTISAHVERPGSVTVNAVTLHDIVRKLPDGATVALTYDDVEGRMRVEAGRSRFELATLPRKDFPIMASAEYSVEFSISYEVLKRLFEKSQFAASTEETRYYLNGVYMHVGSSDAGASLRCVATDGHRLAQIDAPLPAGAEEMPGVIVPRKTVGELRKLLEGEGDIKVAVSAKKVRFVIGQITLTSKVIDGTFPDYTRVIPAANARRMEVDAAEFVQAVDRVSAISSERSRAVKMSLESDRLVLSINAPDVGAAEEELNVSYQDEALEIGFNAKYLQEIASQVDRENAIFLFNASGDPMLMREGDDSSAIYVVMPMRV